MTNIVTEAAWWILVTQINAAAWLKVSCMIAGPMCGVRLGKPTMNDPALMSLATSTAFDVVMLAQGLSK